VAVLRSGVSFRLFRFPVRVQIWFFVTLLFISVERLRPLFEQPFLSLTTFFEAMIVATVAVLVHELGHAVFYRRYGQEPSIVLWGLGGLTFGQSKLGPKREILVSAAGPLIGILLMGLPAWAVQEYVLGPLPFGASDLTILGYITINDIKWFALFWSLVNLLPMIPLDGGHITEAVLELVRGEPQKQTARIISVVTGVIFGTATFFFLGWSTLFLFLGYGLALYNFIAYRQEQQGSMVRFEIVPEAEAGDAGGGSVVSMDTARRKRDRRSAPDLAEAGYQALERRDYRGALKIVERMRSKRLSSDLGRQASEIAALAWLGERNAPKAAEAMGQLPRNADSSRALVAVLAVADKRVDDGLAMMVRSLTTDPPSPSRIVAVDLFAEYGMIHRLARELVDLDGGAGFEAAVALEGMLHQLNRTQDAATVSDVILLG
jgi:Zn-dependent protease